MNLITIYNNDPELINSEFDTFLLAKENLSSHYQHETTNLIDTLQMIHKAGKQAFGWINRFIFENEIEAVTQSMIDLIDLGIDGFAVNDFGLYLILRDLGFTKPVFLVTNTTITNHLELQFLAEQGFDKIMIARELTFDEIVDLASKISNQMIVPIFGHQIISTSRRQLVSVYNDLIDSQLESNKVYKLRESTRQDYFLLYQDETGTHIFDEKVLIGFEGVVELVEKGVSNFWIDSFNLRTDQLIDAAKSIRDIVGGLVSSQEAVDDYLAKHKDIQMTNALWTLKTSDKKENLE